MSEPAGPPAEGGDGLVTESGDAAGLIAGFSHVVLMCADMDRSVRFYRDLLGLRVLRTQGRGRSEYERQYVFELGNGEQLTLCQVAAADPDPPAPLVSWAWPGVERRPPARPQKLDHLAFDVASRDVVQWFHARLRARGVEVSEVHGVAPPGAPLAAHFYFYDPDLNPLEIASAERAHPGWRGFDRRAWLRETDPVPALRERPAPG